MQFGQIQRWFEQQKRFICPVSPVMWLELMHTLSAAVFRCPVLSRSDKCRQRCSCTTFHLQKGCNCHLPYFPFLGKENNPKMCCNYHVRCFCQKLLWLVLSNCTVAAEWLLDMTAFSGSSCFFSCHHSWRFGDIFLFCIWARVKKHESEREMPVSSVDPNKQGFQE